MSVPQRHQPHPKEPYRENSSNFHDGNDSKLSQLGNVPNGDEIALLIERMTGNLARSEADELSPREISRALKRSDAAAPGSALESPHSSACNLPPSCTPASYSTPDVDSIPEKALASQDMGHSSQEIPVRVTRPSRNRNVARRPQEVHTPSGQRAHSPDSISSGSALYPFSPSSAFPRSRSPCSDVAMHGSQAAFGIDTPRASVTSSDFEFSPRSYCAAHGSRAASGIYTPTSPINQPASAQDLYIDALISREWLSPRSNTESRAAVKGSSVSGLYSPSASSPVGTEDFPLLLDLSTCGRHSPRSDCAVMASRAASGIYTPDNRSTQADDTLSDLAHSPTSHDAMRGSRAASCVLSPTSCTSREEFPSIDNSWSQGGAPLLEQKPVEIFRRTTSVPTNEPGGKKHVEAFQKNNPYSLRSFIRIADKVKRRSRSVPKPVECLPNPGTGVRVSGSRWFSFQARNSHGSLRHRLAQDLGVRC